VRERRRWTPLALLCAACTIGPAREPRVLLIGLDGVRVDVLAEARTPNIDSLIAHGTFVLATPVEPTVSGPNWSSMLTGVTPEKHGVHSNDFSGNAYDRYPDVLSRLELVDSAFRTAAVVDWPPLGSTADGGPLVGDRVDRRLLIDGDSLGYDVADSLSVEAAAELLASGECDAVFVYLGNIDVVGHETGSLSADYRAAVETADRQVGRLVEALRGRPDYEDWLILVSTDHGRRDDGGHGGESVEERTIFFLASGPSVVGIAAAAERPRIVDVAVTALAHLGIAMDPAWGLDGRVTGIAARE
jgi:predicted AlkP superfamily pyrophosphatase or phosphodiesterase